MKTYLKITLALIALTAAPLLADSWSDGVPLSVPRAGASAITYNGKIYVFGGKSLDNRVLNSVEVFDSTTNSWDTTLVAPFNQARYNAAAIVWGRKVYLIGGQNYDQVLKSVEVYDFVQNSWGDAHELLNEREGHTVELIKNRIFCFGGSNFNSDNLEFVDEVEWYDGDNDEWVHDDFDMEYPRAAYFSAVYDDIFYVFGGSFFGGQQSDIYQAILADTAYIWSKIGSLSLARAYGATAQIDSLVYLIGGETAVGKTGMVEIYNLHTGKVEHATDMPATHSGMASAVLGGKIYVMGGFQGGENDAESDVHILTPTVTALSSQSRIVPQTLLLAKAYPNPFNGTIRMDVEIPLSGEVQIDILNMLGQKIIRLQDGILSSGKHSYRWNAHSATGGPISSGIYVLNIQAGHLSKRIKLVYVK